VIGTVKWFNEKGFGVITDESGKEYFVHYSAIIKNGFRILYVGDVVQFDESENSNGPLAINVTITARAPRVTFSEGNYIKKGADM